MIQLSHANDEPRHHGADGYTSNYVQDEQRSTVCHDPVGEDINDVVKHVPKGKRMKGRVSGDEANRKEEMGTYVEK